MARTPRHAPAATRSYRTTSLWQDLALLSLVLVVAGILYLTWTKFH